jgi:hypothetical protein
MAIPTTFDSSSTAYPRPLGRMFKKLRFPMTATTWRAPETINKKITMSEHYISDSSPLGFSESF